MKKPYSNIFNLKDKVAVIIGGGGYLCGEMARGLGSFGCKLIIIDIRLEKATLVSEEISQKYKVKTLGIKVDVQKRKELNDALNRIETVFGNVDILINGAGINSPKPFFEINDSDYNNVMNSQIFGTFLGCQIFGKHMVKNNSGSIINISSASAGPPLSKAFVYSVAKAGIKNLTQNLAREWAPHGVRVNAIRPGFFPTEWNKKNFITKEREKQILGHTPMNRYGNVEELVGGAVYLSSQASSFVTGSEIAIDGGFSCMTI